MSKKVAIGIDLGTTNSCVAVFRKGRVDIIINEQGNRTTPSSVAFDETEVHVGEAAKDQASVNAKNTVFEVKRLIGRKFNDVTVQDDMKQWPFEVFGENDKLKIRVQYRGQEEILAPEKISAMVLKKLKKYVEDVVREKIHDAVITVPAYFNDSQRQATVDAGVIAGLNVLQIFNEPTAAALAYGHFEEITENQTVLVFDLGGGTFDVSILEISDKKYVVKAVGGDTHLGGGDFDARVTEYYVGEIKKKSKVDISQNTKSFGRLKEACENAKIRLSTVKLAKINLACLIEGEDFKETLSRVQFELLCNDLFKKTIEHVQEVLTDAELDKSKIDEVILVGGSSRIPKIQTLLSEFFDGKELNTAINPDESVAYGAAVRAALASGEHTIEEITLSDVVPFSLGMPDEKGDMVTFIKRNSRIPIKVVQRNWTTVHDYQKISRVNVYEGQRILAENNNLLGTFKFDIGERELAGVPKNTFTFEVDTNGILHVSGVNEKTKCSGGVSIIRNEGRHTKNELERMVTEVQQLDI